MALTTAGEHPDLLDDVVETAPAAAAAASDTTPSPEAPNTEATPAAATSTDAQSAAEAQATSAASTEPKVEAPSWQDQIRAAIDAGDQKAALRALTKNLPKDDIARDDVIAGLVGDLGQRRAKALLAELDTTRTQSERLEAAKSGDFYKLGEAVAPEILAQLRSEEGTKAGAPFLDGIKSFQDALEPEVQSKVAGKDWPDFTTYLKATVDAAIEHRLSAEVEREITKREPVLRKQWLSETNGDEPAPEIGGGAPRGVREITDEQVAAMSLEEFDQFFDANGKPKAGVKLRITRGVDTKRRQ